MKLAAHLGDLPIITYRHNVIAEEDAIFRLLLDVLKSVGFRPLFATDIDGDLAALAKGQSVRFKLFLKKIDCLVSITRLLVPLGVVISLLLAAVATD